MYWHQKKVRYDLSVGNFMNSIIERASMTHDYNALVRVAKGVQ